MRRQLEKYSSLDDHQLVESVLGGDEGAIKFLFMERCGPGFKHLLWEYRTLGLEFHELVSEMCVILMKDDWKALRNYRGSNGEGRSCKIENYVNTMASNHLYKKMTKAMKEKCLIRPLNETDDLRTADHAEERWRWSMELIEAIMNLPNPVERLVLLHYKIKGEKVSDVAEMLKTTEGNVYTICNRACTKLRSLLTEGSVHD